MNCGYNEGEKEKKWKIVDDIKKDECKRRREAGTIANRQRTIE